VVDGRVTVDRRAFMAGVVATAATIVVAGAGCSDDNESDARDATTTTLPPVPENLPSDVFALGVASGDPLARSVILWTRLVADIDADDGGVGTAPLPVRWEVASDEDFVDMVVDGTTLTDPALAHSVHVEAEHLQPDNVYWYRFRIGDRTSPVGRTRTAPADDADPARLTFAFASCQNRQDGFWTAYEHMADEELDLVLFLGDYIYEEAPDPQAVRTYSSDAPTDLAGYRRRWAEYKADPALQGVHHRFPWVVTWDDHEVANDYADDVPQDASATDTAARESFLDRRAAAYQAFYEHQPVRLPSPDGPDYPIHRNLTWGGLAAFYVLDGRQHRSDQACTDQAVLAGVGPLCADAQGEDRTMLGTEQEQWLGDALAASDARWNVVAQQTVVAHVPLTGQAPDALVNLDQWDGYPAARRRLVDQLRDVRNPVVITGDIHLGGVGVINDDPDDVTSAPLATELVGTSISSSFPVPDAVEAAIGSLPNVRYVNARQRGYVVCTVERDQLTAEFKVVGTVARPDSAIDVDAVWVVDDGDPDPHAP
jgi:alkaline phosphatase D